MNRDRLIVMPLSIALLCGISIARVAAQTKPYDQGKRAYDESRWDDVVKNMGEAIKTDGREHAKARLSLWGSDYFPHFYLAQALHRKGMCAEALGEWETSEQQRAIRDRPELSKAIHDGYDDCDKNGYLVAKSLEQAYKQANDELNAANAVLERLFTDSAHDAWSKDFEQRLRDQRSLLLALQKRLPDAKNSRLKGAFDVIQSGLGNCKKALDQIESEFKRRVEDLARPKETSVAPSVEKSPTRPVIPPDVVDSANLAFNEAESQADRIKRNLAPNVSAELKAISRELARGRTALKAAFETVNLDDYKKAGQLPATLKARLDKLEAMGPAAGAPEPLAFSDELKTGFEQFFTGHYDQAVAILTDDVLNLAGATVKPHAHAIRAAALLDLYYKGQQAEASLLERAKADVRRCKELDANFSIDVPVVFSPRFVTFFKNTQ